MLDDLKYIHEKDAQDALGIAEQQWKQLEYDFNISWPHTKKLSNIVFAGMGGSALAALLSKTWPKYSVPFEIIRNYEIPTYVGANTLFIASSYSGNTEETITATKAALKKGAHIAVIASGGELADLAKKETWPLLKLPGGLQPRHATLYSLKALVTILDAARGGKKEYTGMLAAKADFLKKALKTWAPTVPASRNLAKQIAQECMGKSVVIYAGPKMFPAAYKWKISFNENAKNVAWCNELPEFNHNEFLGWTSHPTDKPYTVIDLRSNLENKRVQKRFEISEKLLSGLRPHPEVVEPEGKDELEQLLWVVALGDYVSLYTALLNGLNPTPVDIIEKLKDELKKA